MTTKMIRSGTVRIFPDVSPEDTNTICKLAVLFACHWAFTAICNDKPCAGICPTLQDIPDGAAEPYVVLDAEFKRTPTRQTMSEPPRQSNVVTISGVTIDAKVYRYCNWPVGSDEFITAMLSGQTFECDYEMWSYWRTVIPPVVTGVRTTLPTGRSVMASFGFAEGADFVTVFWIDPTAHFGVLSPKTRFFGCRTNVRVNQP